MALPLRTVLAYTGFAVGTVVLAIGSVWPFVNGMILREKPEYLAAHEWMLRSRAIGDLVGGHRETQSDVFPKGGSDGQTARYEFRISGDLSKQKVGVIVKEEAGAWRVDRAAYLDGEEWVELPVE